jgi:Anti-sigma-K factor rskA
VAHCDPEVLALRALGEPAGSPAEDAHLAACGACRSELDELRAVVATGRATTPSDRPVAPPEQVWSRITAELGEAGAVRAPAPGLAPAAPPDAAPDAGPRSRRIPAQRRWRVPALAAAALGGVVAGVAGSLLVARDGPAPDSGTEPAVVAQAPLDPLPDRAGTGTARVEQAGQGRRLVVDTAGLDAAAGFYEVWLLDAATGRMVSLGVLSGSTGAYALPPGLELGDYPLVDVSLEPYDGDPAHSGDSHLRGELGA